MPSDPTLYLYTSLTAGSSHIITATSRIETILKANKIPFKAVDCATDTKARLLWQRRAKNRKLPGLVKFNDVIADLEQVEEWNEYGELEEQIEDQIDIFGDVPISETSAEAHATHQQRVEASKVKDAEKSDPTVKEEEKARTASETRHISISEPVGNLAMRQAGVEAAKKANEMKKTQEKKIVEEPDKTLPAETEAKTVDVLVKEGRVSLPEEEVEASEKSTEEQVIELRRKSSVPVQSSGLAQATSIDEAETIQTEKADQVAKKDGEPAKEAKISATDEAEEKVLKGTKPQEQKAADASKAGDSVGD